MQRKLNGIYNIAGKNCQSTCTKAEMNKIISDKLKHVAEMKQKQEGTETCETKVKEMNKVNNN